MLVLCTGNSCRSHLAEGILRAAAGDILDVASAGSKPAGYVHPLAIAVMKKIGIDITAHRSKHMDVFLDQQVETVITVCGQADQACPLFPGQVNRHHWPFDDPAHATGTEEENLAPYRARSGLDNVEFRLSEIEHLPVADSSVDVVISNCVINLSPDKPQVWREIARVLKPGGRVAVSDLALRQPLPDAVRGMVEALVGCVAGAVLVSETERMAREAGLVEIHLNPRPAYVDAMADWQDPLYQKIIAHLPPGTKPGDYVTSLEITARRPAAPAPGSAPGSPIESQAMTTWVYETIPQNKGEEPEYFEIEQSMRNAPLTKHPETGKPIRRVILGGYGVLTSAGTAPSGGGSGCCAGSGCCDRTS